MDNRTTGQQRLEKKTRICPELYLNPSCLIKLGGAVTVFPEKEQERKSNTGSGAEGQEDVNFCWILRRK
jgi:hypothetical protein